MGQGLRLALQYFLCHLRYGLVLLHARLLPKRLLPPVRRGRRASGLRSFADLLQLVVPSKSCVRPSSRTTSRARYSGLPHRTLIVPVSPRHSQRSPDSPTITLAPITASSDLTRNPCPPILFLRYPAGWRLGCPMPKRGAPRRPWPALSMSLSRRCPPSAGRSERGRRPGTPPAR